MDKELGEARKARWNKAFSYMIGDGHEEDEQVTINRKATIVIEHLIQASDVSHTMQVSRTVLLYHFCSSPLNFSSSLHLLQHWHVYAKVRQ